jgi:uncharacterized protein DUF3179
MDRSRLPEHDRVGSAWLLSTVIVLGLLAWVLAPAVLIHPFKPQTPLKVAVAFELRQKAPLVTLVGLALLLPLLVRLGRRVRRAWQWIPLVLLAGLAGASTWFARQNHFEWMFNPLPAPTYAPATLVDFVDDADMVVAVEIDRDAVAWPVRQMGYHHIVQETVGGRPLVATY